MGDAAEKQEDVVRDLREGAERMRASNAAPPEMMTMEEAAEFLRVNRKTLTDMIESESPPWAKRIGKLPRISRSALLKWFETEVSAPKKRRA